MDHSDSQRETIPQACVVPFRRCGDAFEFCLITSLKKKRWIFPKGIVDPGETLHETALKEALEEAGLRGRIVGPPLGTYQEAKWGATLNVTVLLMEVTRCERHWHEADLRQRRWVRASSAREAVSKKQLKRFADAAFRRLATRGEQR
jgi:8-oxo-dGTP pyrophosphatase MutT (NUDIX family)